MNNKVEWSVGIPPEVETEYTGTRLYDYFNDSKVQMEVQLESSRIFNRLYGLPERRSVSPTVGSYLTASILGTQVEFPKDNVPQIRKRLLESIEEVKDLKAGELPSSGLMPMFLGHCEYMRSTLKGADITVDLEAGCHGPFTTAVLLRGIDFFADIMLQPEECKILIEKCLDVNIQTTRFIEKLSGKKLESLWIGDDYGGMISPELYGKFDYPYLERFYQAFGVRRSFHCETLRKGHLKYLNMLGIDFFDPGISDFLTVKDIICECRAPFSYNLFTVRDMLNGTPETIRNTYMRIVEDGAPSVTAEICRNTPKENILAFVEIARKYE